MNPGEHYPPSRMPHAQSAIQVALEAFRQHGPGLPPEDIASLMGLLEMLMQDCSQSNIQAGKMWVVDRCTMPIHYEHFARVLIALAISRPVFSDRLHLIYLINDVLAHSDRQQEHWIKHAVEPHLAPLLCVAYHFPGANDAQRHSVLKVLDIWRQRHIYEPAAVDLILANVVKPEGTGPLGPQIGHGVMGLAGYPGQPPLPPPPHFPIHHGPVSSTFYPPNYPNSVGASTYGYSDLQPNAHHQGFVPQPAQLPANQQMMRHHPQWGGAPPVAAGGVSYQNHAPMPRPQPHLNPHIFPHSHAPPPNVPPPVAPAIPEIPKERAVRTADMRAGEMVAKVNVKNGYYATLPSEITVPNVVPPPSQAVQDALDEFYESVSGLDNKSETLPSEGWSAGYLDKYLAQVAQAKIEASEARGRGRRRDVRTPAYSHSHSRSRSRSWSRGRRHPDDGSPARSRSRSRRRSRSRPCSRTRSRSRGRSKSPYRSRSHSRSRSRSRDRSHRGPYPVSNAVLGSSALPSASGGPRFYPPPAF